MRPKDIGTRAETAVVRYLVAHGWPLAERRALHGTHDLGDITGTPGLVWEVKGGEASQDPSDKRIDAWLTETEVERAHAGAAYGILVCQRRRKSAGLWWAWLPTDVLGTLLCDGVSASCLIDPDNAAPVRIRLDHLASLLALRGWVDEP